MIFTVASLLIVLGFFKLNYPFPKLIDKALFTLGEVSYGVYLIHPIVILIINKLFKHWAIMPKIGLIMGITMVLSIISYRYFETFFMQLARKR